MVQISNAEYASLVSERGRLRVALDQISEEFGNAKPSCARMGELAERALYPDTASPIVPVAPAPAAPNLHADFRRFRAAHPDGLTQYQVYVAMRELSDELLGALEKLLAAVRSNNPGGTPKTQDQIFAEAGHEAIAAIAAARGAQ